jgi:hypothetical protein
LGTAQTLAKLVWGHTHTLKISREQIDSEQSHSKEIEIYGMIWKQMITDTK